MSDHTPGPWIVSRPRVSYRVRNAEGVYVLETLGGRASVRTGADACLIAAAPDLLGALRDLREAATDAYKAGRIEAEPFVRAGLVIAKAEGRQ